jgi:hypothetical protein
MHLSTPTKIAAARASERFTKALADLASRGLRTHCQDPEVAHLWLSEIDQERAQAAILCSGCLVELECWAAAAARDERFGVWSGQDRTRKPNRPGRPKKIESVA